MTETAEERTKRRFREYLELIEWTHQYSFFYQDSEDAKACALGDATRLKEKLRKTKALKNQPFLYRLCLLRSNAYHTIFTTQSIDVEFLAVIFQKISVADFKIGGREVSEWKIEKYKHSVSTQKPHNLIGFFGDKKINRIALLNGKAIP